MKEYLVFILLCFLGVCVRGQIGTFDDDFGYIDIREGAHTFYWLFYTTANVTNYTERPLVIWLQGGPGGSSVGYGNFEILGPLDLNLEERNTSWVKNFNLLLIDNPVGTGFSYVDDLQYLTTTNDEIAADLTQFMRGFYQKHPEFVTVPLYIYGQSYGGKMAIDFALHMHQAINDGTIQSNLLGVAMGNAWISPVDSVLTWAPLLEAVGLINSNDNDFIMEQANETQRLFDEGLYFESTTQWAQTQRAVLARTHGVDFYNVLTKRTRSSNQRVFDDSKTALDEARDILLHRNANVQTLKTTWDLNTLMNTLVKEYLQIPDHVIWGSLANPVFDALRVDFMKPVTNGIERLLNETNIIVTKYNGNLDLICGTLGQMEWMDRLQWPGADGYRQATRQPIWVDNILEGYSKSFGNLRFFWINVAGHSVPLDNPAGSSAFLRDMTSFG